MCLCSHWGIAQTWDEKNKIVASDRAASDQYGEAKAVGIDGDYAVVGAPYSGTSNLGAAYVYKRNHSTCKWEEVQKLTSGSSTGYTFGLSVSISQDLIAVAAYGDSYDANGNNFLNGAGAVYIFKQNTSGLWVLIQKVVATDREVSGAFGCDVDLDGNKLIVGSWGEDGGSGFPNINNSGAAYIFEYNGSNWVQTQKLVANVRAQSDWFGFAVGISGKYAVVGSWKDDEDANELNSLPNSGSAYIYEATGSGWIQVAKVVSSDREANETFGSSVDIDGDNIIVGATRDTQDENGLNPLTTAGAAFIFSRDNSLGTWPLYQKIDASDRDAGNSFGSAVSIKGETALVGAFGNSTDEDNLNFIGGTGSAYLFNKNGASWVETQKVVASDRDLGDRYGNAVCLSEDAFVVAATYDEHNQTGGNPLSVAGSAYVYGIQSTPATQPTVSISQNSICTNGSITLTVTSGNLNGATHWEWYAGSCNSTSIGTGSSIVLTPGTTTTYFVKGVGPCANSTGLCGSIIVSPNTSSWQQTTKNTLGEEISNDVTIDDDGNVYVVGYFINRTTLNGGIHPDLIINTGSGNNKGSFVAKYSPCGDLIWEAHSFDSGNNEGKSIVVDENNHIVYIAGNYENLLRFTSSINPPSTPIQISNPNGPMGYVAGFEMSDGSEVSLDEILRSDEYTTADVIAIDETSSTIFIGGTESTEITGIPHTSYVYKYHPSNGSIGPLLSLISSTPGSVNNQINDMDYDEIDKRLFVIGDFEDEVSFLPGSTLSVSNPSVQQDAFLLSYRVTSNSFITNFNMIGNTSDFMSGEGIVTDRNTGNIYFTGSYTQTVSDPFPFAGFSPLPGSTFQRAYMIGFDFGNQTGWTRVARVAKASVDGKSVSMNEDLIYFTGNFNTRRLFIQNLGSYANSPPIIFNQHVYVAAYKPDGSGSWGNVTTDPTGDAVHNAESIAANKKDHVFVVGNYTDQMHYLSSNNANSLVSTGAGANAFVLRANAHSGKVERVNVAAENESFKGAIIVPNPTTGQAKYTLAEYDEGKNYTLRVVDILGQVIFETKLAGPEYLIDLSSHQNGIYFIQVSDGEATSLGKVVKTN